MSENIEEIQKYKKGWFACAVVPGFEQKVYRELKKLIYHDYFSNYIYDIFIPTEKTIDKRGREKTKIVPAYTGIIYINMMLTTEVYSMIRIEGFIAPLPAKDPVPIPPKQMEKVLIYRLEDEE